MLPWQPEFKYNQQKKLMQPFPKPDDTLNEIWLKLVLISPIFQLSRDGSSWVEPVLS